MNYFLYCQLCLFENRCELRHNEFLMGNLSEVLGGCEGKISYDSITRKLKCEKCEAIIERQAEKGVCGKFNPHPVIPAKGFPSIKTGNRVVRTF